MEALKETSAQCAYCKRPGYGKGIDDYGHVHCRMCRTLENGWVTERSKPAEGDVWGVQCDGARNIVNVKAVILKHRHRPCSFNTPEEIFRTPCRMIHVTLGKDIGSKTFVIHEPLLTSSSAYFQRALQSTFKEGLDCQVDLSEEDPLVFGLLNEYLYKTTIKILPAAKSKLHDWKNLLVCFGELWLLAHYLQMPKLINYSMWRIMLWMDEANETASANLSSAPSSLDIEDIYDLYDKAPMDSNLRRFLVDLLVWSGWGLKLGDEAPHLMLREMVDALRMKCKKNSKSPLLDVRNYYVQEEELVSLKEQKEGAA